MAKNKKPARNKEANILKLPANSSKDERLDLQEYSAKAQELANRQMERINKAKAKFDEFLANEGYRQAAKAPISELYNAIGAALQNPEVKQFEMAIGLVPLEQQPPQD